MRSSNYVIVMPSQWVLLASENDRPLFLVTWCIYTSIVFFAFPQRKVDAAHRMGRVIPDLGLLSSIFDDAVAKKCLHFRRVLGCIEDLAVRLIVDWTGHSTPDFINSGFFVHIIGVIQLQGILAISVVTAVRLESEWPLRVIVRVRNHEGVSASLPPALSLVSRLEVVNLAFSAAIRGFAAARPGTGPEVAAGGSAAGTSSGGAGIGHATAQIAWQRGAVGMILAARAGQFEEGAAVANASIFHRLTILVMLGLSRSTPT